MSNDPIIQQNLKDIRKKLKALSKNDLIRLSTQLLVDKFILTKQKEAYEQAVSTASSSAPVE